ncbi:MAG: hypothetical protein OXI43_17080 [Candidatus Poribacteria bacterium]|nr:hypothetical protein [Candidatus Poribacteria bacterium]
MKHKTYFTLVSENLQPSGSHNCFAEVSILLLSYPSSTAVADVLSLLGFSLTTHLSVHRLGLAGQVAKKRILEDKLPQTFRAFQFSIKGTSTASAIERYRLSSETICSCSVDDGSVKVNSPKAFHEVLGRVMSDDVAIT